LYPLDIFNPLLDGFESLARGRVLPVIQPAYTQSLLIALLFVAIVALNALAPRFWCRYLCPLGALLGMLAKISLLRPVIGSACNRCTRCVLVCRPGAIDFPEDEITSVPGFQPSPAASHPQILASECTLCLDCLDGCKQSDIRFQVAPRPAPAQEFDLTRRQALQSLAAGAAGVLLLGSELAASQPDPHLVRPPGVEDEAQFLQRCIRCASCIKICPTTALQPTLVEAGLGALWTPRLIPRAGYCDFGCNACGQVCPSGAIPDLSLETKRQAVIYKASVNRDRCLPWASATPCIVCEEMCPLPEKAIQLEEVDILAADGGQLTLQRPSVDRELCIGCGICEHACPLEGEAAIRVYRYLT
jgi:ferredoxin